MKPELEKIQERPGSSFIAKVVERPSRPHINQAWHYHPEIEICYTPKSIGKRFTGNKIQDYIEGDLVMFGSNLPHGFTTDDYCRQIVVQMNWDFLGSEFISSPELRTIVDLFKRSHRGLIFTGTDRIYAASLLNRLPSAYGMERLIMLLDLLSNLSNSENYEYICTEDYANGINVSQLGRLKLVYDHIMDNFNKEVRIKDVADKLNISEAAFYKFIKKQTQKTYTEIINEFRINYASKLLTSSEMSISEVCFSCGYNNLSYFNRKFKQLIKETPHSFRKRVGKKNMALNRKSHLIIDEIF